MSRLTSWLLWTPWLLWTGLMGPGIASPRDQVPPADPPEPVYTSVRSRLFLRLDPSAVPAPDGRLQPGALGSVRLLARGEVDAEASGWIAHAPGAASYHAEDLSGTLTTLSFSRGLGPLQLTVGRQWTRIGSRRLTGLDGVTAVGRFLDGDVEVAARTGLSGLEPRAPFGKVPEAGGHVAFAPLDGARLELGLIHQRPTESRQRTRWTAGADWQALDNSLGLHAFGTTDIESQALVEGRLESFWRPSDSLWLRGYGRLTRVDLLFEPDELLAVFAEQHRGEVGGLAEYLLTPALRLRLDGAAIYSRDRVGAGRYRAGVDLNPFAGATALLEGTLRVDRVGYSATARAAGRMPLVRSLFGTLETLGDLDLDGQPAGFGRLGTGFEPWPGWFAYGALEVAYARRWPDGRLSGLVLFEHALGAPVRWGSGP